MSTVHDYIRILLRQTIQEKKLRGQKSKRTLYHIGPRPAEPKPKQRWQSQGQPEQEWERHWLSSPVKSGVFLTPNPTDIVQHHGVSGNVYAYKVPEWVIAKSGGIHRFDVGSEILIPEDVWNEAGKEIEFLGKTMSQQDLWDSVESSWTRDAKRKSTHSDRRESPDWVKDQASLSGLRATSHPEAAVKMMSQEEIKSALAEFENVYAQEGPAEVVKGPRDRKGLVVPHFGKQPRGKDKELIDLLMKHMKESVVREYIRSLLLEDAARRKQFAQHLIDAGHSEANFETPDVVGDTPAEVKRLTKVASAQGRLLKKAFAETADRAFLNSLVTVHWFRNKKTMEAFIDGSFSSKDELSTAAYLPGEIKGTGRFGEYGILIKGHITLLANDMDQLYTGATSTYRATFPEKERQSGINKGAQQIYEPKGYEEYKIIVLDKEDWDPSVGGWRGTQNNEALVDNWSPMAIIVPDSSNQPGYWDEDLQKMEPAGPDTAEADIVWKPLLKKAGLDIPVMTHKEFTSRGWI